MHSSRRKNHRDLALEQLEIAAIFRATLDDIAEESTTDPTRNASRGRRIAEANNAIGQALKVADIHATLAVAEAVATSFPAHLMPTRIELVSGEGVTL